MQSDEVMRDICSREINYNLFNFRLDGVSIYQFISRGIREKFMELYGLGLNYQNPPVSKIEKISNLARSLWQISKILLLRKKGTIVFHCFDRLERIDGIYLEKFTDPIIDELKLRDYVILEPGRSGRHMKPRLHNDRVVYTSFISLFARIISILSTHYFKKKNSLLIDKLFISIESAFPEIEFNKASLSSYIHFSIIRMRLYQFLFKKLQSKILFAPARGSFMHIIPSAKKSGMKVFELQHGVTYKETITYSGYFDSYFTPDYFLSFGKIHSASGYGVKENQVVEIGFAFENYIKKHIKQDTSEKKVLVVSSPNTSFAIVKATCNIASQFPDVIFYFRPHPLEQLDNERKSLLLAHSNIVIDDNQDSVYVTLNKFKYVLGESTTVLYEALPLGKKVGKLHMEGLEPRYIYDTDKQYFYQIEDKRSFSYFIYDKDSKPSIRIHSDFKPDVLLELIRKNL